jgi:hypothetical protein
MEIANGTATGTGAALKIPIGFAPDMVIILNITSAYVWVWTKLMTNATALVINPTDAAVEAAQGITPYSEAYTAVATQTVKNTGVILGTTGQAGSDALLWIAFRE